MKQYIKLNMQSNRAIFMINEVALENYKRKSKTPQAILRLSFSLQLRILNYAKL